MTNGQLIQIENLKALSQRIEKSWAERVYSNKTLYLNFDLTKLSKSKKEQYKLQVERAPKVMLKNGDTKIAFPQDWIIRFYITAEWIVADWARRHFLSHIDFNEEDPYSAIDCNIDGINIDVKTTLGLGRRKGIPLYNRVSDESEIQVAIWSKIDNPFHSSPQNAITRHAIQGIFDPNEYSSINIPLKFFLVKTTYKNCCYFQPLENYFNIPVIGSKTKKFDMAVLEFWLNNEVKQPLEIGAFNFNLCSYFYVLRNSSIELQDPLRSLLPKIHHDFIPTVIELENKKKMTLLPHYLADYLVTKIMTYAKIDANGLINILFSIYYPNEFQREFLLNLIKLIDVLPEVRCRWHPDEGIEHMGFGYDEGYIPTFYFKCQQDPTLRTTIYSYSWKTLETVLYKVNPSCNDLSCGGLTHTQQDKAPYSNKVKTYCKDGCKIHGSKAHKKITEQEIKDYYSNYYTTDNDGNVINSVEDIPF